MPTYSNANFFLNLTYVSTQPTAGAVYTDSNLVPWYFSAVTGTGATANYAVTGPGKPPVVGTLTKVSGTGASTVVLNTVTLGSTVVSGSQRMEAGQVLATTEWLQSLPFGVIQLSTTPFVDTIISSTAVSSTTTVTVPATTIDSSTGQSIALQGNYKIRIYGAIGTGYALIQLNSTNAVSRYLGLYEEFEVGCRTRTINSIIVTISGTFTCNVNIEKI